MDEETIEQIIEQADETTDSQPDSKPDLSDVREAVDEALAELRTEAKRTGELLDPRFPKLKQEVKKMILEHANISEEEFDAYVQNNPDKKNSKIDISKIANTLDEAREKGKSESRRKTELALLVKRLESKDTGLSKEELFNKADSLLTEAERVHGHTASGGKEKYLRELVDDLTGELMVEADTRKEDSELKNWATKAMEKIRGGDWWKKSMAKIPRAPKK